MAGNLDDPLTPADATTYRGLTARGNFLAQDRPDVAFATKELCREFAGPANASLGKLKRLGRYLLGRPRLVYRFDWVTDGDCQHLTVPVDTDFAGCRVQRRSTSGGVLMRGPQPPGAYSSTESNTTVFCSTV